MIHHDSFLVQHTVPSLQLCRVCWTILQSEKCRGRARMHLQVQTADGTRRLTLSVQDPNAWENMAVDVFDKLGLPAFASSGQDQDKGRRGRSRRRSCSPSNSSGDGEDDEEEEENEGEGTDDDEEKKSTRGLGGQDIMRGDTLERISRYITPRSLQRLACTCKHLRWFCSTDEAWRPWLKRLVASPGRNGTTGESAEHRPAPCLRLRPNPDCTMACQANYHGRHLPYFPWHFRTGNGRHSGM